MARVGLALAGLGALALMTGCGGDSGSDGGSGSDSGSDTAFADQSADDIVKTAKADMGDLKAVKVSGAITSDGQDITIDLQANSDGDCTGTIGAGEGKAEMLGVGGDTWMKPDETFWRTAAGDNADQIISLVGDKWVVIPAGESLSGFCDLDSFLDQLLSDDSDGSDPTYSTSGTDEVDGDEVVKVDSESKSDGTSTGYVLTDDPHYLVKIEKTEGTDTGEVSFSEFDESFDVEPPSDDEVVDLDKLGG